MGRPSKPGSPIPGVPYSAAVRIKAKWDRWERQRQEFEAWKNDPLNQARELLREARALARKMGRNEA